MDDGEKKYIRLAQYELKEQLGAGQYGVVKLAHSCDNDTDYAMKIISKRRLMKRSGFLRKPPPRKSQNGKVPNKAPVLSPLDKVYKEIALLKKISHPNLVKLIEVLDEPGEDILYMVFELLPNGESLQIPADKPLDEKTAQKYFRDVLLGLDYLHFQHIIHRDIKPANLLLDSDFNVKISDLGVSIEVEDTYLISGQVGTPAFMSPEVLDHEAKKYNGVYTDLWALGVTLYSFLFGFVPWTDITPVGINNKIRTQPLKFDGIEISEKCVKLITSMLTIDIDERPTIDELFCHEWVCETGAMNLRCNDFVIVTEADIEESITTVPKIETLIMVKQMLKKHSFKNPFFRKKHKDEEK